MFLICSCLNCFLCSHPKIVPRKPFTTLNHSITNVITVLQAWPTWCRGFSSYVVNLYATWAQWSIKYETYTVCVILIKIYRQYLTKLNIYLHYSVFLLYFMFSWRIDRHKAFLVQVLQPLWLDTGVQNTSVVSSLQWCRNPSQFVLTHFESRIKCHTRVIMYSWSNTCGCWCTCQRWILPRW